MHPEPSVFTSPVAGTNLHLKRPSGGIASRADLNFDDEHRVTGSL